MSKTNPTVRDIIKKEGIYHFQAEQPLSQITPKLTSSHDAAFVFDKDQFIGIISPMHLIKKRSYHQQTKARTIAKMPQKLSPTMKLSELAQVMLTSHVFHLPVMEDDTFLGIATINRLFSYIVRHKILNGHPIIFTDRDLVTMSHEESIDKVIKMMRDKKIARIPLVNGSGGLVGIISQYDLKDVVPQSDEQGGKLDRHGDKENALSEPVKNYMTSLVVTVDRVPKFSEAVTLMRDKEVGSLIIVDTENRPMSIVTKRDLLQTVAEAGI